MPSSDASLGELVSAATRDLSSLMRQEVQLAKVEIKQEVAQVGKGAGMLGGAGIAGLLALIFLSISAAYGISNLGVPLGCAYFLVGVGYALIAGGLVLRGRKKLSSMGAPQETVRTVKDDITWAKHPTQTSSAREGATTD